LLLFQVAGRKRVTLLPPDAHPCVYLFPSLHPRARKSQVPAYARAPAPSTRRRQRRNHDGSSCSASARADPTGLGSHNRDGSHSHDGSSSHDDSHDGNRRGDALAPHFLAFLQNGTWLAPEQRPTSLEQQFPKLVGYLRSGTCDHPGTSSPSSSSLGRGRAVRNGSASRSGWGLSAATRQRPRPWAVVLAPGDALYIPPLWLHSVEALDASISVNAFAPSTEVGP
jgi:hypothetical protein